MSYLFADDQRARLKAAEDLLDAGTIQILERVSVEAGWRCLEVGAGGGSIARWLAERVAPTGHVVATDINTRDLDAGEHAELEVRQHDVVNDALEESSLDLVHARLVLVCKTGENEQAFRRGAYTQNGSSCTNSR